eukprot:CAMPEP_0118854134 /NCGR_PEP_ID=MMETSP1163-20130328/2462_1 /TAXON_ID=124430 /ORGANISM="Phaeomonas parva, Strain CCMP2877" /LENGTH=199 /DNA_ID=CAMNT_0006786811 /DNA_START=780 /DNA_END=1377 /DNA_ORIENTATION=+
MGYGGTRPLLDPQQRLPKAAAAAATTALGCEAFHLLHIVRLLRGGVVLDTDAVHAVALVGRRGEALPLEHVAQVAIALGANDLRPEAVLILDLGDGSGHTVVEGRPAAAAVELAAGVVERRAAASALVGAILGVLGAELLLEVELQLVGRVLAEAGRLRRLLAKHGELVRAEDDLPALVVRGHGGQVPQLRAPGGRRGA